MACWYWESRVETIDESLKNSFDAACKLVYMKKHAAAFRLRQRVGDA